MKISNFKFQISNYISYTYLLNLLIFIITSFAVVIPTDSTIVDEWRDLLHFVSGKIPRLLRQLADSLGMTGCAKLVIIMISSLWFLANPAVIFAQNLSLSISPPLVEIMIKPGKTVTQSYKIRNEGEPVIVNISLLEYRPGDLRTNPDHQPENWIQIINNDLSFHTPFLLNSNQEKQVILKINPPAKAPEEEYYRVLMFSTTPNPAAQLSESRISQNLGSILLINVTSTGEKLKAAQLTKSGIPVVMDSFDPLKLDFDIQNTGKTYFRPIGEINLNGSAAKANFKIVPKIILPGQIQRLVTESDKTNSQYPHSLYLPGFYLGKYSVNISFTLDDTKIKIEQSKTFYALPWKAFLVLIIFLLTAFQYFKMKKKKHAH